MFKLQTLNKADCVPWVEAGGVRFVTRLRKEGPEKERTREF